MKIGGFYVFTERWGKVISRRDGHGVFTGELSIFRLSDDKLLKRVRNTIQTKWLQETCKGAATGSFNAIDKMEFFESGPASLGVESTSKIAGGTGAEDYTTWEATWTNMSGVEKTVTQLELGYDLGGGSEMLYSQITGLSEVVPNTDGLKVQWKIVFAAHPTTPGDITDKYRYEIMKMANAGTFSIPAKFIFDSTEPASYPVTASLEAGGDGTEVYHQWTGTHTATSAHTVDIIKLSETTMTDIYTTSDIVNKPLDPSESYEFHLKITHSAA